MRSNLLDTLDLPGDLRRLSPFESRRLAQEVRDMIVDIVSKNGGHLAPSLGVVELTMALLSVLDVPRDKIVWDVGHQCYAHKILTDRKDRFRTLRQSGGISGFPRPSESPCDCFATGHASTAISAAAGIASARDIAGDDYRVVAVVGDGAMGGGMVWEAINNAGDSRTDLLVVLNDNRMSISPSIGAFATHISRLRAMPLYRSVEHRAQRLLRGMPLGGGLFGKAAQALKRGMTTWVSPTSGTVFEALGFEYLGPIDGHDFATLRHFLSVSRDIRGPVLLHVVTTKGKGYHKAEHKPRRYHGVGPFKGNNGKEPRSGRRTYTDVFGSALVRLAARDKRIVAITAAMPDGTGLNRFAKKYPERFFNVGIAEAHAVTFAAGLAVGGARPVVAIYSTFLQRAYDQVLHDVCTQDLPVVFALDRAGIVGEDGRTHHGVFDISYARHMPNIVLMAPKDGSELTSMLEGAVELGRPVMLRYPRGKAGKASRSATSAPIVLGKSELLRQGDDVAIIALGPIANDALEAAAELAWTDEIQARVINARFAKPLDEQAILAAASECGALVIAEENAVGGGFGSAVLECLARNDALGAPVEMVGVPDEFIDHGNADDLRAACGLSCQGLVDAARLALSRRHTHAGGDAVAVRQSI